MLLEQDRVLVHPGYFFDFRAKPFSFSACFPKNQSFARPWIVCLRESGIRSRRGNWSFLTFTCSLTVGDGF